MSSDRDDEMDLSWPAAGSPRLVAALRRPRWLRLELDPEASLATIDPRLELELAQRRALLEVHTRSRLAGAALVIACQADRLVADEDLEVSLPEPPSLPAPALIAAARRAGPAMLRRLFFGPFLGTAEELRELLPLGQMPDPLSRPAALVARDLLRARARGSAAFALESAAFRFLAATGDPAEGARAFVEDRRPVFEEGR